MMILYNNYKQIFKINQVIFIRFLIKTINYQNKTLFAKKIQLMKQKLGKDGFIKNQDREALDVFIKQQILNMKTAHQLLKFKKAKIKLQI